MGGLSKNGSMQFKLDADSPYTQLDAFDINGHKIEVGSIGASPRTINNEWAQRLFRFASSVGAAGSHSMNMFNGKTHEMSDVTVHTVEHAVDGNLVYVPSGMALYKRHDVKFNASSFSTGKELLEPGGDSCVSFVTADATIRPADRTMSVATEIMQNRCMVTSVETSKGKRLDYRDATGPYQETLANGVGNMAGAAILGWTYSKYEEFLQMYERTTHLWGGTLKGVLGRSSEFIAPHIIFDASAYEQFIEGDLPTTLQPIARQPIQQKS